jgi:hypothetical protein
MFTPNPEDLQFLFESAGQTVLINDTERQVIITNPSISEYEERYIHTLERVLQGDIVTLEGERYLVITETVTPRHGKYKALMRHCNYIITLPGEITRVLYRDENGNIVYDDFGDPVFIEIEGEPINIPAIVDNKSFSIVGSQLLVAENQIIVTVQDNEVNRNKLKVNNTFSFEGNFKVLHRDFTKKGLMILTCEKVVG